MVDKRTLDYITTILLLSIPFILFLQQYIMQYIPAGLIVIGTLFFAALSQYMSNGRVAQAIEEVKRWKYVQYLITIGMVVLPLAITYQAQILQQLPSALVLPVSVILGFASQYISGVRVEKSTTEQVQEETVPLDEEGTV